MAEVGRPTVMDENTLQILEGYFADGASDELACFLAKISTSTLYNYQNEHPEFLDRKNYLKEQVRFQARKNIRKKIESEDIETSKWYLERKDKEFKQKSDITTDDKPIAILQNVSTDDSNQKDNGDQSENTGNPGGDISQ
jgi:hypothetical protein